MPEQEPATKVGAYELLAKIGEGGMGVVHLAQAPDGRRVAIKLLRPHVVGDDQGRARMAREVTSLRRVRSQRVAEVYDADPWGDTPYVITRYVPGLSLHDHVQHRGPIEGEDLVVFARGLAEALVAVHMADVLHRDVKPSNVLIEGRNPVLIDFGLAQLSDDSKLTHSGWLLGTPGYLAPEILYGDDPTPKADVHSWAATVVFAATARGPYGKGPAVAVMDRVRRGEHDLSGVPEALSWMVIRALHPDPRDRPAAGELVEWLTSAAPSLPQAYAGPSERRPELARTSPPPGTLRGSPDGSDRSDTAGAARAARSSTQTADRQPARFATPASTDGSSPGSGATPAHTPTPWPPINQPPYIATAALWTLTFALAVVGAATVPVATAVIVFVIALLLRTLAFRERRLYQWRRERGVRSNDTLVATICVPWFAVLNVPAALANVGIALLDGGLFIVVAVLLTDPTSPGLLLALGGVVAGLFVWWGPASEDVRTGGRQVARTLLQPGVATLMVLTLLALSTLGLFAVRQTVGPTYGPLPEPPWERALRELVE